MALDVESRYQLLEKIGSGSFATVYRARDEELGREVAVKQIHQQYLEDAESLDRFWKEAQLLASLQHPNIVTIFDLYRDRGWLILELMQTNLADRMQGRPMDVRAAKTTVAHCLRALKYLHERGIVHGDVKPSNMMIDHRKRVKIGDFGLARRVSDEEGSLVKGTTKYMAPEVVSEEFGDVGPASDLYSLGFSAFELLCGTNFDELFPGLSAFGRNKQAAWMMWHAAPDRRVPNIDRVLEGVPEELAHVVDKLVQKDQRHRYTSAREALDDLGVDQKVIREGGPATEEETDDGSRKRTLIAAGALGLSVVMSLAMLFLPSSGGDDYDGPDVVVFREYYEDSDSIKYERVDRPGVKEMTFESEPVITLKQFGESDRFILFRDLVEGDRLEFEREDGEGELRIVATRPMKTRGRIVSLDPTKRVIVLAPLEGALRDEMPLRVPETARIAHNGRPIDFGELEESNAIDVWHLGELKGRGGRIADRIEVTEIEETVGSFEGYDAETKTLSLGRRSGTETFEVVDEVRVTITRSNGATREAEIADLRVGDQLRVTHDTAVHEIAATRDSERAEGIVKTVDAAAGRVAVLLRDGATLDLRVPESADVAIGSTSGRVADLRINDTVELTYGVGDGVPKASSITADRPSKFDRWAIVIATAGYTPGTLSPLPYALGDARRLADTLQDRYAVPTERIESLMDATRSRLETHIADALDMVGDRSQLIVYLGGHGWLDENGRAFLAGKDFDPKRADVTGLPIDWIVERIEATPADVKLLVLDLSHDGGPASERQPSSAALAATLTTPRTSTYLLASCSRDERGRSLPKENRTAFADALAAGFAGRADVDADPRIEITPREIATYVTNRLRDQTPILLPPTSE